MWRTLVIAALTFGVGPATAAEPSDARALFDAGQAALTTGRFAEARDLFRRSLELVPKTASAFNLAVALRGTGEAIAAVDTLDRLIEGAYGRLDRPRRVEAEALRSQARADVARIQVRVVGPPNARLRIDGRVVELPPDGALRIDAGTYVVEASAPAHRTREARVEVARGASAELTLELAPLALTGTLILEGEPDDRVRVVGVAEADGTLERALDPGRYRLEAEGPSGHRAMEAAIVAGQTLRVRLEPERSAWPWVWIGVGAAMLAAGAVITVVALSSDGPEPIVDPTYGVIQTLHRW